LNKKTNFIFRIFTILGGKKLFTPHLIGTVVADKIEQGHQCLPVTTETHAEKTQAAHLGCCIHQDFMGNCGTAGLSSINGGHILNMKI